MYLQHFSTFAAVGQYRSFTRAARELGISQPTVSQQIRDLEERFGAALVERTTRTVRLTTAGERLLIHVMEVLAHVRMAKAEIAELQRGARENLTIGCEPTIGNYLVPELLSAFLQEDGGVRLAIRNVEPNDIWGALIGHDLDAAVSAQQVPESHLKEFQHDPFCEDEISLIVAADHSLARLPAIDPRVLYQTPMVDRPADSPLRSFALGALQAAGIDPTCIPVSVEVNSTEALKQAVRHGLGFGIVQRCAVERGILSGAFVTLDLEGIQLSRPLWLITSRLPSLNPHIERFRRFVLAHRLSSRPPARTEARSADA